MEINGMTSVIDIDTYYYCVGGRTALGISAPAGEHAWPSTSAASGCTTSAFAPERADVDELHAFLR
jgi:hypothetical protein